MDRLSNTFYKDGKGIHQSYETLLNLIAQEGTVRESYAFNNTLGFLQNFLRAIVHEVDITLVDPLHPKNSLDQVTEVKAKRIPTFEDLLRLVISSKVKISMFTSGTTGQPKVVAHSMKTLLREVRINEKQANSVWAFAYNPTHMAGLQVLFQAICNCNPLIDVFGKSKTEILKIFKEENVTHISATPTFYRLLLPFEVPVDSVKSVSLGGEKSDDKLHSIIKVAFPKARVFNIYASTEAGTILSSHGSDFKIKSDLIGKVKIENNELLIHNSLTGDYEKDTPKWFYTGDIIEWIDQENQVFKLVSRKNEMINVGGNKVNPHDVEAQILAIYGISNCFVYGKPNSILGNMICADVVLASDCITEISIKQKLRDTLEAYEIPRKINFVQKLQTTRTGKLKRN
jgi:acyl-coenzyme A synthetase/AMP-(fatty) acid ligase